MRQREGAETRSDCEFVKMEHLSRADRMAHKGPEFAHGLQADPRFDVEIIHWRSIKSRAATERRGSTERKGEARGGKERRRAMP